MDKENCWENMKCGREPKGKNTDEFGVCPASMDTKLNGTNSGKNAGRICWAVTGTFCHGKVQGTFAEKKLSCMKCDFYRHVKETESPSDFKMLVDE